MYKIYYLTSDSDNYQPRYIGYTSMNLYKRLQEHINDAKYNKSNSHKTNWIKKLLKKDLNIKILLLEDDVDNLDDILKLERYYIKEFTNYYKLTNSTNGGETSKVFIDSVKEKISNGLKEYYRKNNPWNKGKKIPNTTKGIKRPHFEGNGNSFYNKKHNDESKKMIGDKNRKHRIYTYDELYYSYIELNLSQKEIAIQFELTRPYVCRLMKKNKLVEVKKNKYGRIK